MELSIPLRAITRRLRRRNVGEIFRQWAPASPSEPMNSTNTKYLSEFRWNVRLNDLRMSTSIKSWRNFRSA